MSVVFQMARTVAAKWAAYGAQSAQAPKPGSGQVVEYGWTVYHSGRVVAQKATVFA